MRVMDLFRKWDRDGDARIGIKELRRAVLALGYDVPREAVSALFDTMDTDGGGQIDYKEMNKALRRHAEIAPELQPGAAGPIEVGAKLHSSYAPAAATAEAEAAPAPESAPLVRTEGTLQA
jgi:hypothetical protein